ncbi:hypothetical protein [Aquifex aeolicus]|uniref:Uncharacterized protein aq_1974 n=1 Tax=Aquifex aeolicus (strain VF5) TaxID=224324 RepID=Y1974_AQUAE|nr:hypothetical protein [Aquifex aeolicus]O67784.1 RecName: Full=Uncharacterized protein aq_1974 [Aquifex aeolicus VF5]AAC07755.1 putative protein [Aquifex aeolicus VF5]
MLKKILSLFKKEEPKTEEKPTEVEEKKEEREEKEEKKVRELTPQELELFKRAMGITPHNYWQWASRTNNFKLLTDGEWVWVEGYEEHIGKQLPLNQARAWSWEFIKNRLKELNL